MKSLLVLSLLLVNASAYAKEDPVLAHGGKLHEEKCMACHDTSVYTRDDRRVKTMAALSSQVNNCMKGAAKADWTTSETNSVIEYLNTRFYKF
jgi:hypothetical protein